jgi:hypothetical protein
VSQMVSFQNGCQFDGGRHIFPKLSKVDPDIRVIYTMFEDWALLGYASFRQRGSCELVDGGSFEKRGCLENGSSLYFVVHLEGAK